MNCWDGDELLSWYGDKLLSETPNTAGIWCEYTKVTQYIRLRKKFNILPKAGDRFMGISFDFVDESIQIQEYAIKEFLRYFPGDSVWLEPILLEYSVSFRLPEIELDSRHWNLKWEVGDKGYLCERLNKCTWRITPRHFLFHVGIPIFMLNNDIRLFVHAKKDTMIDKVDLYYSYDYRKERWKLLQADNVYCYSDGCLNIISGMLIGTREEGVFNRNKFRDKYIWNQTSGFDKTSPIEYTITEVKGDLREN